MDGGPDKSSKNGRGWLPEIVNAGVSAAVSGSDTIANFLGIGAVANATVKNGKDDASARDAADDHQASSGDETAVEDKPVASEESPASTQPAAGSEARKADKEVTSPEDDATPADKAFKKLMKDFLKSVGLSKVKPQSFRSSRRQFFEKQVRGLIDYSVSGDPELYSELVADAEKEQEKYGVLNSYWELYRSLKKHNYSGAMLPALKIMCKVEPASNKLLHEYAHVLRRHKMNAEALDCYNQVLRFHPTAEQTRFERARLLTSEGFYDLAQRDFAKIEVSYAQNGAFYCERGRCYSLGGNTEKAIADFEMATRVHIPDARGAARLTAELLRLERREEALEAVDTALSYKTLDAELRMQKARILCELGRFAEAVKQAELLVSVGKKTPQKARFFADIKARAELEGNPPKKILAFVTEVLSEDSIAEMVTCDAEEIESVVIVSPTYTGGLIASSGNKTGTVSEDLEGATLAQIVDMHGSDAVFFARTLSDMERLPSLSRHLGSSIAAVEMENPETESGDRGGARLLSGGFLNLIMMDEGGAFAGLNIDEFEAAFEAVRDYCNVLTVNQDGDAIPASESVTVQQGPVWLVSNSGIQAFGGVERFLRGMYVAYAREGESPLIVGLINDGPAESGSAEGFDYANLPRSIGELASELLSQKPKIVHGTTGVGYELLAVTKYMRCSMVYGSHFWRDMFYGSDWFKDVDLNQSPRSEFQDLASLAEFPYSNSLYTTKLVHRHFKHTQSIIFSLPQEIDDEAQIARSKDPRNRSDDGFVLLLNARMEKGMSMLLDVAERLPHVKFVAVASQSSLEFAQQHVADRHLENVEILSWVSDANELYSRARVVLAPSFEFVETFSRVVIEASRHGLPVIGSDRGNIPLLLTEAGVALPQDADQWTDEIRRLYEDADYYAERSEKALENSARYPFELQHRSVERIVRAHSNRIAVAVGSGIGNVVQTLPAVNKLAEHFGVPVDVILSADFDQTSCLFLQQPSVANALNYTAYTRNRLYDTVVVLDCFGRLPPNINARKIINSRNFVEFKLTQTMPEAEFYLHCLKVTLGIDYEPEDVRKMDLREGFPHRPIAKRIGVHGGSKKDIYAAKQWPHFAELVGKLKERGYEVCSFGVPDEYVEGCVDMTGTPLIESISNMATCSAFVANDSGLMHIADALHIPLVTLFAPTSVIKNGPLSTTSRVIGVDKECSPCQFDMDRFKNCKCILDIEMHRVMNDLDVILGEKNDV